MARVFDQRVTRMYDDIWMETGLEEEEIFNDFYDYKCPFNARYVEIRDASWRRLTKKLRAGAKERKNREMPLVKTTTTTETRSVTVVEKPTEGAAVVEKKVTVDDKPAPSNSEGQWCP